MVIDKINEKQIETSNQTFKNIIWTYILSNGGSA